MTVTINDCFSTPTRRMLFSAKATGIAARNEIYSLAEYASYCLQGRFQTQTMP